MRNVYRPFEALKLIRDGVINDEFEFDMISDSRSYRFFRRLVQGLTKLGFIERASDRKLRTTEKLSDFLSALDLSLVQLSGLTPNSVVCSPSFGSPSEPATKADIFVLMPFSDALQPVYHDHIKKVAADLNRTVARADDFFTADSIISDIWNAIHSATVIIADCTGRNPNVFYEIGIAHTLGKRVVLTAQTKSDIPFDVHHLRTIIYDFTPRGMQEYEKSLRTTLELELRYPQSLEDVIKEHRHRFGAAQSSS